MEIDLIPDSPIVVEIKNGESSVKFTFRKIAHNDLVYAATILKQIDYTGEQPVKDRLSVVKYVFDALLSIEGDQLTANGEIVTVEKLKELAAAGKIAETFSAKICIPWATEILQAQGFFKEALKRVATS